MKKIFKLSAEPLEAEADWERFLEAYRLDGSAPSEKKIIQSPFFLKFYTPHGHKISFKKNGIFV